MADPSSENSEFENRVGEEVHKVEQWASEVRDKFEGWGFSPIVDQDVRDLIHESGFRVSARWEESAWRAEIEPKNDGKFDAARAKKALERLERQLQPSKWSQTRIATFGPDSFHETREAVAALARPLCSAAKRSLEEHGDLRDAVKEMGEYELRNRSHPNAKKRDELRSILYHYIRAREQYKDEVDEAVNDVLWLEERVHAFVAVAGEYLKAPYAHTPWLTSQIAAWLLRPFADSAAQAKTHPFPQERIGASWRQPWCIVIPLSISILLLLLGVALVAGCYMFLTPMAAYGAAGVCGLVYVRRYLRWREAGKQRVKMLFLAMKVSAICNDLEVGIYNATEVIRRLREMESDFFLPPSILVSVIALSEKPAQETAT